MIAAAGLGCVAVAAGASRWLARSSLRNDAATSAGTRGIEDAVRVLFAAALVAGLVLLVVMLATGGWRRPENETRRRSMTAGTLLVGVALVLLALLLHRSGTVAHVFPSSGAHLPQTGANGATPTGSGSGSTRWGAALGLLALVVVAAIGLVLLVRSRHATVRARATGQDEAAEGSDDVEAWHLPAAFDPDAEPDDRLAVIAVYHWVLDTLARHGRGRQESEAPFDHVRRVLSGPDDPLPPAWRVTSAFELARYSDHEVPSTLRAEAVAASRTVVHHFDAPDA